MISLTKTTFSYLLLWSGILTYMLTYILSLSHTHIQAHSGIQTYRLTDLRTFFSSGLSDSFLIPLSPSLRTLLAYLYHKPCTGTCVCRIHQCAWSMRARNACTVWASARLLDLRAKGHMCVYMYVCKSYACVYVCAYVYVYVRTSASAMHTYVCTYVRTYACMYVGLCSRG